MVQVWKQNHYFFVQDMTHWSFFEGKNHITFTFIKTMSHDLLVHMAYYWMRYPEIAIETCARFLRAVSGFLTLIACWLRGAWGAPDTPEVISLCDRGFKMLQFNEQLSPRTKMNFLVFGSKVFLICNQFLLWFRSLNVIPLFPMPSLENYVQKIHKKLNNEGLETRKVWLGFCYAYVLWLHLDLN